MLTGFTNFVSNAFNAVKNFFGRLGGWFQRIVSSTQIVPGDGKVSVTFPDYDQLAEELSAQAGAVQEATKSGDKGRHIAGQMKQFQIVKNPLNPAQAQELNDNVAKVGHHLGMAFESGVVLYLVNTKKVPLDSTAGIDTARLQGLHDQYIERVRRSYVTSASKSTATRENFIKLLYHHVAIMAEQIYEKSMASMKCQKLMHVQYIGVDHMLSNHAKPEGNIAGADLILVCEDSGEVQYYSTKYMSNPHSSVAKKAPADVHRMLGGLGNRSDEYYARLTAKDASPQAAAQHVLLDLWDSLREGYAKDEAWGGSASTTKVRLKGTWVANMFSNLFDGDYHTKPAFVNYARGQSTVGEFSPAMQRDFRTDRNGDLASKEGAYGEAVLEGFGKQYMAVAAGRKPPQMAIKIKYIAPGTPASRGSYIKIYVNPTSGDDADGGRWSKYNVQIQANNLTTK